MKITRPLAAASTLLLLLAPLAHAAKPLKVFILAGQSNMVGTGSITTFPAIGMDPETAPMFKLMVDAEGKPIVCEGVSITAAPNPGEEEGQHGKLTADYGAPKGGPKIGPEYTFGIYAHQMLGEPILIIKTAWGGKSLVDQFRPPSAGGDKPTGDYYKMMMDHINKVLADPKVFCPEYDAGAGYELAGFAWFQGYNDYINKAYPGTDESLGKNSPKDYSEYTRLLGCFIRDIRNELKAPKMPFVIGVFGMQGKQAEQKIQDFRNAQAAVAEQPEFKGNVVNVFTENYWSDKLTQLKARELNILKGREKLNEEAAKARQVLIEHEKKLKNGEFANPGVRKNAVRATSGLKHNLLVAAMGPEDTKLLEVGTSNQGFHYWGSAKFYAQAGKAFAEALIQPKAK